MDLIKIEPCENKWKANLILFIVQPVNGVESAQVELKLSQFSIGKTSDHK